MPTSLDAREAFALFDLEPSLELDLEALERDYLRRSRECHPDHHAANDPDRLGELLDRSARLNDAHRLLGNRWERAQLALEAREPGVVEAAKSLDPAFLMDAMEWAEASAEARSRESANGEVDAVLREEFGQRVERYWRSIGEAFAAGDLKTAATRLHESKYARKALEDLQTSG